MKACPKCKTEGWTPYFLITSGPWPGLRWCPVRKAWMCRVGKLSIGIPALVVSGVIRFQ